MTYLLLALAIIAEVSATLCLKLSNGWEKTQYGSASIALYAVAGMIFAMVLKDMGVGVAYAIWSGAGIALVVTASVVFWEQKFDLYAVLGIVLILSGSLLITTKSAVVFQ